MNCRKYSSLTPCLTILLYYSLFLFNWPPFDSDHVFASRQISRWVVYSHRLRHWRQVWMNTKQIVFHSLPLLMFGRYFSNLKIVYKRSVSIYFIHCSSTSILIHLWLISIEKGTLSLLTMLLMILATMLVLAWVVMVRTNGVVGLFSRRLSCGHLIEGMWVLWLCCSCCIRTLFYQLYFYHAYHWFWLWWKHSYSSIDVWYPRCWWYMRP